MPSTSSTAWKAKPISCPKASRAFTRVVSAPASTAPTEAAYPSRAPVLSASMARQAARSTSSRSSKAMSAACPAIMAAVASTSRVVATTRSGVGSSSRTWKARVCRASPDITASSTPKADQTVAR